VKVPDFMIASVAVNLPMCFLDVCIGAGAKHVDKSSPLAIFVFVSVVVTFLALVLWIGARAKKKLEAFDAEDKQSQADHLLGGGAFDEKEGGDSRGRDGGERGDGDEAPPPKK
jgi:hypothetical protein